MTAISLKTPISYYGGKAQLLSRLLPFVPTHTTYCEPFFGGGALFFAKEPSKIEIVNDTNKQLVNFYRVAKRQFLALKNEIDATLYSEEQYQRARRIYFNKEESSDVLRAWALFVLSHQTFLHILDNEWTYSKSRDVATTFNNKKLQFDERYVSRLEKTQIFCRDAVKVIRAMDSPDTFCFLDPPYVGTDCGHYVGYTNRDLESLMEVCQGLKGKFLLSNFPSQIISEYAQRNAWYQVEYFMHSPAKHAMKTEVFTMNFTPSKEMLSRLPK